MCLSLVLGACAEQIDETGSPVDVGAQRRTEIDQIDVVESAQSKDEDVIDVIDYGEGFVRVEGVGEGEADVIAKGGGTRVRIKYLVQDGGGADDLQVEEVEVELLSP